MHFIVKNFPLIVIKVQRIFFVLFYPKNGILDHKSKPETRHLLPKTRLLATRHITTSNAVQIHRALHTYFKGLIKYLLIFVTHRIRDLIPISFLVLFQKRFELIWWIHVIFCNLCRSATRGMFSFGNRRIPNCSFGINFHIRELEKKCYM